MTPSAEAWWHTAIVGALATAALLGGWGAVVLWLARFVAEGP